MKSSQTLTAITRSWVGLAVLAATLGTSNHVHGGLLPFPAPSPLPTPLPGPGSPVPLLPRSPDLIVHSVELGMPAIQRDGSVLAPITIVIANVGNAAAGFFMVSADAGNGTTGGSWVTFTAFPAPGIGNVYGNPTVSGIAPWASVRIIGNLHFARYDRGATKFVRIQADSPGGVEFLPWYVRVQELREWNNYSVPVPVRLPR